MAQILRDLKRELGVETKSNRPATVQNAIAGLRHVFDYQVRILLPDTLLVLSHHSADSANFTAVTSANGAVVCAPGSDCQGFHSALMSLGGSSTVHRNLLLCCVYNISYCIILVKPKNSFLSL